MTTALCFDLDGVLISTPLVALVASATDIGEEIEVLTKATDDGLLPFARSLRLRCRLLRDVTLDEAQRRIRAAAVNQELAAFIATRPDRCFAVSGIPDVWAEPLAERLGCRILASAAVVEDGRVADVPAPLDKAEAVAALRADFDRIVAVGSGSNDLGMMEAADVRVAFGFDPPDPVREVADHWTTTGRALCQLLRPL